jgi:hypothetical protein
MKTLQKKLVSIALIGVLGAVSTGFAIEQAAEGNMVIPGDRKQPAHMMMTGMPNPMCEFPTVAAAANDVGLIAVIPPYFRSKEISRIFTISHDLLDIRYADGTTYRMAFGDNDVSGDYNHYQVVDQWQQQGYKVTARGAQGSYHSAIWTDGSYTYAATFPQGVTQQELQSIIK